MGLGKAALAAIIIVGSACASAQESKENVKSVVLGSDKCLFAGYIYAPGQMLKMESGVTKICTTIKKGSLWLAVDQKDLERHSY